MPTRGRVPRPKHLFPEVAAVYFTLRRWGLRAERFFYERAGWYPIWTVGALSGTLGLMLTVMLFVFHVPVEATGKSVTQPLAIAPQPDPVIVSPPVESTLLRPRATLDVSIQRVALVNGSDFTTVAHSHVKPVARSPFTPPDPWQLALQRPGKIPLFEPYLLTTQKFPVSPVLVTASNQYDVLRPVAATRMAGIQIDKVMTATASLGEPYTYIIRVHNVSQDVIPNVEIRERVSALHRVSHVQPDAHVEADELVWHLNQLPAGDLQELKVTLLPDQITEINSETSLAAISRIGAVAHVTPPALVPEPVVPEPIIPPLMPTPESEPVVPEVFPLDPPIAPILAPQEPEPVVEPMLEPAPPMAPDLRFEVSQSGVLKRGETLSLVYEVTNVGNAAAENVVINVDLSPEFQHRFGKSVQHRIERLEPGKTHKAILKAVASEVGTGELSAELTLKGTRQEQSKVSVPVQPIEDPQVLPASGEQTSGAASDIHTCNVPEEAPTDIVAAPLTVLRIKPQLLANGATLLSN